MIGEQATIQVRQTESHCHQRHVIGEAIDLHNSIVLEHCNSEVGSN